MNTVFIFPILDFQPIGDELIGPCNLYTMLDSSSSVRYYKSSSQFKSFYNKNSIAVLNNVKSSTFPLKLSDQTEPRAFHMEDHKCDGLEPNNKKHPIKNTRNNISLSKKKKHNICIYIFGVR